ncbi:uncharacterized protein [Dermacentor albipictus]|uniref:uncharacterized protein isoform X2 n=1 Tax=Dermacentor albipictus TaxID=60249 RepID=UPI0031FC1DE0
MPRALVGKRFERGVVRTYSNRAPQTYGWPSEVCQVCSQTEVREDAWSSIKPTQMHAVPLTMLHGRESSSEQNPRTGYHESRHRSGALHEGLPEAKKDILQAAVSCLPVVVSPPQLDFYLDKKEGHTQVLTLYNINDHPVHFLLMSNAPRRFGVSGRTGIITPHCYTEVVVNHCDLSEANVGIKDNLRIVMSIQGSRLRNIRDVPAVLWATRSNSDDEDEKEDEDDASQNVPLLPAVDEMEWHSGKFDRFNVTHVLD